MPKNLQEPPPTISRRTLIKSLATSTGVLLGAGVVDVATRTGPVTSILQAVEGYGIFSGIPQIPNTVNAKTWNLEQKGAFIAQAAADVTLLGKNAAGKRKRWYEFYGTNYIETQGHELSCEFKALEILLKIKGINSFRDGSQITEDELINRTPINVNPTLGRPENIDDDWGQLPPNNYGIYAKALAGNLGGQLPSDVKLHALDNTSFRNEQEYKEKIALLGEKGLPFLVWIQQDTSKGAGTTFYDKEYNQHVPVAPTEHCVVCLGASKDGIIYADPYNCQVYRMEMEGPNGLIERARAVGFNLLTIEKNNY